MAIINISPPGEPNFEAPKFSEPAAVFDDF